MKPKNLDKLYVGREFHNFVELLIFLELPSTNGNGKKYINRKKLLSKYIEWENPVTESGRKSHRIVITKIIKIDE